MSKARPEDQGSDTDGSQERRQLLAWLWRLPVLLALGGAGYAAWEAYHIIFTKGRPNPRPTFAPLAPIRIAPLRELTTPWDAAEFIAGNVPAIALNVPAPIPGGFSLQERHFAAFSRVCTHQGCIVNLNTNLEAIAVAFNYRTEAPALVCRCHLSVYDPLRSGRAVSGPAVLPLPRVQLEDRGDDLYATGLEIT